MCGGVVGVDGLLLSGHWMWTSGQTPVSSPAHQKIHLEFPSVASLGGRGMGKMTLPSSCRAQPDQGESAWGG